MVAVNAGVDDLHPVLLRIVENLCESLRMLLEDVAQDVFLCRQESGKNPHGQNSQFAHVGVLFGSKIRIFEHCLSTTTPTSKVTIVNITEKFADAF